MCKTFSSQPANVRQFSGLFFHFINLSDVGRSLDSFQVPGSFSTQPADVQQVTGQ